MSKKLLLLLLLLLLLQHACIATHSYILSDYRKSFANSQSSDVTALRILALVP